MSVDGAKPIPAHAVIRTHHADILWRMPPVGGDSMTKSDSLRRSLSPKPSARSWDQYSSFSFTNTLVEVFVQPSTGHGTLQGESDGTSKVKPYDRQPLRSSGSSDKQRKRLVLVFVTLPGPSQRLVSMIS